MNIIHPRPADTLQDHTYRDLARRHHPAWDRLHSRGVRALFVRNVSILAGALDAGGDVLPVRAVIAYTPNGLARGPRRGARGRFGACLSITARGTTVWLQWCRQNWDWIRPAPSAYRRWGVRRLRPYPKKPAALVIEMNSRKGGGRLSPCRRMGFGNFLAATCAPGTAARRAGASRRDRTVVPLIFRTPYIFLENMGRLESSMAGQVSGSPASCPAAIGARTATSRPCAFP